MKILLLASADTHTRRFTEMLLNAGHEVIYVATDNPNMIKSKKFKFKRFSTILHKKWMRPYRFYNILIDWIGAFKLRLIWQQEKPDIAHVLYIDMRAYYCKLARFHPLILTALGSDINDIFENKNKDSNLRKKIVQALRSADHLTSDTYEILHRCEFLAGQQLNTSLFYFGIDLNLFRHRSRLEKLTLRKELGVPPKSKIILSPRRIISKMRHDFVMRAFSKIVEKKMLDVVLVLCRFGGYSFTCEQNLKNLAKELQISDRVFWTSNIDYKKIPVLYSLADMVINIPEQDGLPVTLFEVSACQTPVITSDLSAYQEFLAGGTYPRVPVGDLNGLLDAMNRVLFAKSEKMKKILHKNYKLVVQKADQEKCFFEINRIYQEMAKL